MNIEESMQQLERALYKRLNDDAAKIARLRALVVEAYNEGWWDYDHPMGNQRDRAWECSDTKRALGESAPPEGTQEPAAPTKEQGT